MMSPKLTKKAILVLNDVLKEDFNSIIGNIEFKENLLVITNTKLSRKDDGITYLYDKLEDIPGLLKKLHSIKVKGVDFCGIIGLDEEYRYGFSKAIADEFGLQSNPQKTLESVSDKYLQIQKLKQGGVNVPEFRLVDNISDSKEFPLPCVIKPIRGISSIHVYKAKTDDDLKNVFKRLEHYEPDTDHLSLTITPEDSKTSNTKKRRSSKITMSGRKRFVMEEFIDGNEYSCDFLVGKEVSLLRVVKKIVSKDHFPFFEGLYLFNPDEDESAEFSSDSLRDVCRKIATSLDIRTGLCMIDFRFDANKKKIVVIETTTRSGVDDFIGLMHRKYGYISLSLELRQIFGTLDTNALKKLPKGNSIILYLMAPRSGTLKRFDTTNLERLKLKGLKEIVKYNKVGDRIAYLGMLKNPPYIGHVIIDDIALKDIDATMLKIRSNVDISLER